MDSCTLHGHRIQDHIKWSTTAQHQFAHTSQTCRGGLQNELATFYTIYISYRKSTLLRLIKKSSCYLCLCFTTTFQTPQWFTDDFHKYHTNFKKTTSAETHNHANSHIVFFFWSLFCTKHFKNIKPYKFSMKKHLHFP